MPKTQEGQDTALRRRFEALARTWKAQRGPIVSIEKVSMQPAYQAIIGMGPAVVPYILQELEREPDHWFWALHAITQANPVPVECEGKLNKMAAAWIEWGRNQGFE